jgi:hypothetical protein
MFNSFDPGDAKPAPVNGSMRRSWQAKYGVISCISLCSGKFSQYAAAFSGAAQTAGSQPLIEKDETRIPSTPLFFSMDERLAAQNRRCAGTPCESTLEPERHMGVTVCSTNRTKQDKAQVGDKLSQENGKICKFD